MLHFITLAVIIYLYKYNVNVCFYTINIFMQEKIAFLFFLLPTILHKESSCCVFPKFTQIWLYFEVVKLEEIHISMYFQRYCHMRRFKIKKFGRAFCRRRTRLENIFRHVLYGNVGQFNKRTCAYFYLRSSAYLSRV